MKTNQLMEVKIGTHGIIRIGHKSLLANVSSVLAVGNKYRAKVNAPKISNLVSYLRKPTTWRTIIAIHNKMVENNDEKVSCAMHNLLLDTKTVMESLPYIENRNWVDYAKVIKGKQFAHIIKSQHGGKLENRGYHCNLYLAIDIAMMMNEEFKVELIDIFVKGKILENRDQGGDAFKKLNVLIDTLPDRIAKAKKRNISIVQNNKMVYRNIATMINKKINGAFDEGWNDEKKEAFEQERRAEILKQLCSFINMGFVQSYDSLKETIGKL